MKNRSTSFNSVIAILLCGLGLGIGSAHASLPVPRGRPYLNAARTTFVADNGHDLRGPFTSTEWTGPVPAQNIANMKDLGFNAVHLYAEDFNTNYPNGGSAPGYSAANVERDRGGDPNQRPLFDHYHRQWRL